MSGTHYGTYWLSNLLFDYAIYFVNISLLVMALKIVSGIRDTETSNEAYIYGHTEGMLGYIYLFMLLSALSWCILAYLWSYLFKSDVVGFIVLLIVLALAAFIDMIMVLLKFLDISTNSSAVANPSTMSDVANIIRLIFSIIFPNVAVKRALYNLKIRNNNLCMVLINTAFKGNKHII